MLPPPPPGASATLAFGPASPYPAGDEPARFEFQEGRVLRRVVRYHGGPIPSFAHIEWRNPMADTGRIGGEIFLASYVASGLLGVLCVSVPRCTQSGLGWLLVPVVGPLVAMLSPQSSEGYAALTLDALAQAGGMALVIASVVATPRAYVVEEYARREQPRRARWTILPGAPGAGVSLSVTGF